MWKIAFENIKIALTSIRSQVLRTCITIFIIAIGIWALVGILSVVSALRNTIIEDFTSLGANTFTIQRYDTATKIAKEKTDKPNPIITYAEASAFKEAYKYPLTYTSLSFHAASQIEVKGNNMKTDPEVSVYGCDENYLSNSGLKLTQGRNFNFTEIANNQHVCVIGADFAKKMFKDISPIHQVISIRGYKFKVIGLLKEQGSTFGNNEDQRIFIPVQVARTIFNAANINYTLKISTEQEGQLSNASDQAIQTFRSIRNLTPSQKTNFGIERSDDMIRSMMTQVEMLNLAAWLIGLITILSSSIALMNIMLVSVTERTREIGVRKSLGAKKRTIAQQFFTETVIIGQLGGLLGTLLGLSTAYGLSSLMDFSFSIPWNAIIAAFITTFIVAVISGLYPAIKASKLDPVEALRYE
ncbi:ABC transporter permease [Myroides pelagicus]|uniref:FtsX-like permease family protein n=1 Tax=Myroides pelagicus TaxID=270914 RepID=A0A7K1GM10_9FLAO|nr:ABC transporter permease [Myroides pelagicus]MEC4113123.1 ABC transporter permease [Myroides pelagicus]MTH29828.1 FtsX-like permease family protein [Myroides pelagicus]